MLGLKAPSTTLIFSGRVFGIARALTLPASADRDALWSQKSPAQGENNAPMNASKRP
jgi:hypothetical protein